MKHLKRIIIAIAILAVLTLVILLEEMQFTRDSLTSIESRYDQERMLTLEYTEGLFSRISSDGEFFHEWFVAAEGFEGLTSLVLGEGGGLTDQRMGSLFPGMVELLTDRGFDQAFYRDPEGRVLALLGDEEAVIEEVRLAGVSFEGELAGGYAFSYPLTAGEEALGEVVLWVSMDHIISALEDYHGHGILHVDRIDHHIPFDRLYGLSAGEARRTNALIDEAILSGRIEAYELNVHQLENTLIVTRILPLQGADQAEAGYLVFHEENPVFHYGISVGYRNSRILFLLEGILVISLLGGLFVYRQTDKIIHEDKLTRLYTRGYFKKFGRRVIEGQAQNAAIILDIDNLKRVNEAHGLNEGDRVLETVGGIIKASIRPQDIPIRWSGEEFVIVMPGTSLEHGKTIAELIRIGIEDYPFKSFKVTASLGVFVYDNYEDILAFLNRMDENILITKSSKDKKTLEISR